MRRAEARRRGWLALGIAGLALSLVASCLPGTGGAPPGPPRSAPAPAGPAITRITSVVTPGPQAGRLSVIQASGTRPAMIASLVREGSAVSLRAWSSPGAQTWTPVDLPAFGGVVGEWRLAGGPGIAGLAYSGTTKDGKPAMRLFTSADRAEWRETAVPAALARAQVRSLTADGGALVLLAELPGGAGHIARFEGGKATEMTLPPVPQGVVRELDQVVCQGGAIAVTAQYEMAGKADAAILFSRDRGTSWVTVAMPHLSTIVSALPTSAGIVALGSAPRDGILSPALWVLGADGNPSGHEVYRIPPSQSGASEESPFGAFDAVELPGGRLAVVVASPHSPAIAIVTRPITGPDDPEVRVHQFDTMAPDAKLVAGGGELTVAWKSGGAVYAGPADGGPSDKPVVLAGTPGSVPFPAGLTASDQGAYLTLYAAKNRNLADGSVHDERHATLVSLPLTDPGASGTQETEADVTPWPKGLDLFGVIVDAQPDGQQLALASWAGPTVAESGFATWARGGPHVTWEVIAKNTNTAVHPVAATMTRDAWHVALTGTNEDRTKTLYLLTTKPGGSDAQADALPERFRQLTATGICALGEGEVLLAGIATGEDGAPGPLAVRAQGAKATLLEPKLAGNPAPAGFGGCASHHGEVWVTRQDPAGVWRTTDGETYQPAPPLPGPGQLAGIAAVPGGVAVLASVDEAGYRGLRLYLTEGSAWRTVNLTGLVPRAGSSFIAAQGDNLVVVADGTTGTEGWVIKEPFAAG